MNKKFYLAISIFCIVVIGVFAYGYSIYTTQKTSQNKTSLANDIQKLHSLVLSRQCSAALTKADIFLLTYPDSKEILTVRAVCQFTLGNSAGAKVSFTKILSLDPQDQPAKNYLAMLNASSTGVIAITGPATPLSKNQLEAAIKLLLGGNFQFLQADERIAPDSSVHISGVYISNQTAAKTISLLKNKLTAAGIAFTVQNESSATVLIANLKTSQTVLTVINNATSTVQVIVNYIKFNG